MNHITNINQKEQRLNEELLNNQGCLMKIVIYNFNNDIIIEFQDKYKARVHSTYKNFKNGKVKNPYCPSVNGVGIIGNKYPHSISGQTLKEYDVWSQFIARCHSNQYKNTIYKDASCCDEWLLYESFYEWLHSQSNFDKWLNGERWAIDKDILFKGNKIYSPKTCCLVPQVINNLFTKKNIKNDDLPIGVDKHNNKYRARCNNVYLNKSEIIGYYDTPEEAFQAYKTYKESYIKQIAQEGYIKGNITKQCYDAMMNYEVEITD